MPGQQVADILLLDVPVALWADTRERQDALLAALAAYPDEPAVHRLTALVDRLDGTFGEAIAPSELELRAAAARRLKEVDVAYGVPRAARDDLAELCAAWEAVDRLTRRKRFAALAELALPPRCVAFRAWFLGQLVGQLDGELPTPWRD